MARKISRPPKQRRLYIRSKSGNSRNTNKTKKARQAQRRSRTCRRSADAEGDDAHGAVAVRESPLNDGTENALLEVLYDALEETLLEVGAVGLGRLGLVLGCAVGLGRLGLVLGCAWVAATWFRSMLNEDPSGSLGGGVRGAVGLTLAVVFCGMWISQFGEGGISAESEDAVHPFSGGGARYLVRKLEAAEFETDCHTFRNVDFWYLIALYLTLRVIVVLVSLPVLNRGAYGMTWQRATVITYGGLRGAVGLTLALVLNDTDGVESRLQNRVLFQIAGIAFLALIKGTTARYVMPWLQPDRDRATPGAPSPPERGDLAEFSALPGGQSVDEGRPGAMVASLLDDGTASAVLNLVAFVRPLPPERLAHEALAAAVALHRAAREDDSGTEEESDQRPWTLVTAGPSPHASAAPTFVVPDDNPYSALASRFDSDVVESSDAGGLREQPTVGSAQKRTPRKRRRRRAAKVSQHPKNEACSWGDAAHAERRAAKRRRKKHRRRQRARARAALEKQADAAAAAPDTARRRRRRRRRARAAAAAAAAFDALATAQSALLVAQSKSDVAAVQASLRGVDPKFFGAAVRREVAGRLAVLKQQTSRRLAALPGSPATRRRARKVRIGGLVLSRDEDGAECLYRALAWPQGDEAARDLKLRVAAFAADNPGIRSGGRSLRELAQREERARRRAGTPGYGGVGALAAYAAMTASTVVVCRRQRRGDFVVKGVIGDNRSRATFLHLEGAHYRALEGHADVDVGGLATTDLSDENVNLLGGANHVVVNDALWKLSGTTRILLALRVAHALLECGVTLVGTVAALVARYEAGREVCGDFDGHVYYTGAAVDAARLGAVRGHGSKNAIVEEVSVPGTERTDLIVTAKANDKDVIVTALHVEGAPGVFFDVDALSLRRDSSSSKLELLATHASLGVEAVVANARQHSCVAVVLEPHDEEAFVEAWARLWKAGFAAKFPEHFDNERRRRLFESVFDAVTNKRALAGTAAACTSHFGALRGVPTLALKPRTQKRAVTKVAPTSLRSALPAGRHPMVHTKSLVKLLRAYNLAMSVSDVTVQLVVTWLTTEGVTVDGSPGLECFDFSQSGYLFLRELALGKEDLSRGKDETLDRRRAVLKLWNEFKEKFPAIVRAYVEPAAALVAEAKEARVAMERYKAAAEKIELARQAAGDAVRTVRSFQQFDDNADLVYALAHSNTANQRTTEWATSFANFYTSPESKRDYENCLVRLSKAVLVSCAAAQGANAYVVEGVFTSKRQLAALVKKLLDDVAKGVAKLLDEADLKNLNDIEEKLERKILAAKAAEKDVSLSFAPTTRTVIAKKLREVVDRTWRAVEHLLAPPGQGQSPPAKKSRAQSERDKQYKDQKMHDKQHRSDNRKAGGKRPANEETLSSRSFRYFRTVVKGGSDKSVVIKRLLTTMLRLMDELANDDGVVAQWRRESERRATRAEEKKRNNPKADDLVKLDDAMDESDDHSGGGDLLSEEEEGDGGEYVFPEEVEDEEEEEGRFGGVDVADLTSPTTEELHALWLATRGANPLKKPPIYLSPPPDTIHGVRVGGRDVQDVLKLAPVVLTQQRGKKERRVLDRDRGLFDVVAPCLFDSIPQLKRLRRDYAKDDRLWPGRGPLWSELLVHGHVDSLLLPTALILRGDLLFVQLDGVESAQRSRSASGECAHLASKGFDGLDHVRLQSRDQQKDPALDDTPKSQHGRGVYRVEEATGKTHHVEEMEKWIALGAVDWGKDPTSSFARVADVKATLHDTTRKYTEESLREAIKQTSTARLAMLQDACRTHAHSTADVNPSQESLFKDIGQNGGELNKNATAFSLKLLGPWVRNVIGHGTNRCFEVFWSAQHPEYARARARLAALETPRPRTVEEFAAYVNVRCENAAAMRERHCGDEGRRAVFARFREAKRGYQQIADVLVGKKVFLPNDVQTRVDEWARERLDAVNRNELYMIYADKPPQRRQLRSKLATFETTRASRSHDATVPVKTAPALACVWERLHAMRRAGLDVQVASNLKFRALPLEHRRRVGRLRTQEVRDHHQRCLDNSTTLMSFAGDRTPGHSLVSKKKTVRGKVRRINTGIGDEYKTSCVCQGCFGRCKYSRDRKLKEHDVGYNNIFGVQIPYTADGQRTCPLCREGNTVDRDYPETLGIQQIFVARRLAWSTPYDRETTDQYCGTNKKP